MSLKEWCPVLGKRCSAAVPGFFQCELAEEADWRAGRDWAVQNDSSLSDEEYLEKQAEFGHALARLAERAEEGGCKNMPDY